jgi:hypothetical protein
MRMKETFRTFPSWSTRDVATGKLEYSNYIHPLADYSFAQYMKSKQIIGWEYRRGDNWQKWLWEESLFDSLCRHMEIIKLLQKGYYVYEIKQDWVVDLIVSDKPQENKWYDFFEEKEMVNELNAVRFNMQWLLLYKLWLYENVQ